MDKSISTQIKGIAILFMIWLHSFRDSNILDLYTDFTVFGEKCSFFITRCTHAVDIFLMLSGFGLYFIYKKKGEIDFFRRAKRLYFIFLIPFCIFVPLGCWLRPDIYPGSWMEFLQNITTWHTTYNGTWWFLFPYFVFLLYSNYLFKLIDRHGLIALLLSLALGTVAYGVKWAEAHQYITVYYWMHQCLDIIIFPIPITIGACINKYAIIDKAKAYVGDRHYLTVIALICVLAIRLSTDFDFGLKWFYAAAIIILYSLLPKHPRVSAFLEQLGKHATTMWLVHAFFIWYLFTDYIYALKYSILIYLVVVILSYLVALVLDKVQNILVNTQTMQKILK